MKKNFIYIVMTVLLVSGIPEANAASKKAVPKKIRETAKHATSKVGRTGDRLKAQAKPVSKLTRSVVQSPSRAPAGLLAGSQEVDKPLKVQGQSRNLSMMLMLKKEKDKIKFGEVRENYNEEISKTNF